MGMNDKYKSIAEIYTESLSRVRPAAFRIFEYTEHAEVDASPEQVDKLDKIVDESVDKLREHCRKIVAKCAAMACKIKMVEKGKQFEPENFDPFLSDEFREEINDFIESIIFCDAVSGRVIAEECVEYVFEMSELLYPGEEV